MYISSVVSTKKVFQMYRENRGNEKIHFKKDKISGK